MGREDLLSPFSRKKCWQNVRHVFKDRISDCSSRAKVSILGRCQSFGIVRGEKFKCSLDALLVVSEPKSRLGFTPVIYCFLYFVCFVASKCELSIKQRGNAVEVPHH